MKAQAGLTSKGFYELRDSTCEKCLVKFDRREENGKIILTCPECGGNIGRLKQKGILQKEKNGLKRTIRRAITRLASYLKAN